MAKFVEYNGTVWKIEGYFAEPNGLQVINAKCDDYKQFLRDHGLLFVRWVRRITDRETNLWYLAQSRFLPLAELSSNTRSKVRRGLKAFDIRPVEREFIARHGYDIYKTLFRLRQGKPVSQAEFARNIAGLPQGNVFYGIFDKQEGRLQGYVQAFEDKGFVILKVINILPQANKRYASYAMFFRMSEIYVQQRQMTVILGLRSILKKSNVQEFAREKFGYDKLFVEFEVCLSFRGKLVYLLALPFRKLFLRLNIKALKYLGAYAEFIFLAKQSRN